MANAAMGLLILASCAALIAAVGYAWGWLSSPPAHGASGPVAALRYRVAAWVMGEAGWCRSCRQRPASEDPAGYCSVECADADADMQAHG